MLAHNVDMVSGIYIQRIPDTHTIEIFRKTANGGVSHVNWNDIKGQGLVPVDGCGFGCALIKGEVIRSIPYPHFVYKSALDHANTYSEDVYFCTQVRDRNFQIWADTTIICDHIGSWTFKVDTSVSPESSVQKRLRELSNMDLLPDDHHAYLTRMRDEMSVKPRVVYDLGACVLHWTSRAKKVWPDAEFYAFEAMEDSEFLFKEKGVPYYIGLFSDQDGKEIGFYENTEHPGGNSYYQENTEFSPPAAFLFDESHRVVKRSVTLDTAVKLKGFPLPDLIKMDVQGAEMDVLRGAKDSLKNCKDLILELQHVEYNRGAPLKDEVIAYVESLGFKLVTARFSGNVGDGDYHFTRV